MRKDGSRFWGNVVITALRSVDGDLLGFGKVTRDLSERRRERARVKAGLRKTAAILESITDAFCSVDREWRYTYINREAERLLGRNREDLLGRNMWELFPDAVGTLSYQECHRAMQEQQPTHFEMLYQAWGLWYENHVYPSDDGISIYFRDVTERKQAEAEAHRRNSFIEMLQEVAVIANEAATFEHALRRSLTSICRPTGGSHCAGPRNWPSRLDHRCCRRPQLRARIRSQECRA